MKYANIDENGKILGWYSDDVHAKKIPAVTEERIIRKEDFDEEGNLIQEGIKETVIVKEAYYDLSNIPTPNIEVSEDIWKEALNKNANFYDSDTKTFEVKEFRTDEEIEDQIRQQKLSLFHDEWSKLKIGYNHNTKIAYQIKFGSELNEKMEVSTYTENTLYNISDLENIIEVGVNDCYIYCDEENMNTLSSGLAIGGDTEWDGSLGKFHITDVELSVILRKAKDIVQLLANEIIGGE